MNLKLISKKLKRDYMLYIMLTPFLLFFIMFPYKSMYAIQIAFKDYNIYKGISESEWVGFSNFTSFLSGPYFFRTLRNTLILSSCLIIFGFPVPIILALMFNEVRNKTFKTVGQTITYLPHFISAVIVAGIVTNFLAPNNGLVNIVLEKLGGEKTYFLTKPEYFRFIYIFMTVWKEAGFNSIIYIAALSNIDPQQYESATIDGANKWQQMLNVTIPGIIPTIIILLILRMGQIMNISYETIVLLYQPATYETADVINTYVYRAGLIGGNYEIGAAAGLFNSTVSLMFVFLSNTISRKYTEISLW